MHKLLLLLVILAIASTGCQTRAAVVTHTPDGDDIALTMRDFDSRHLQGPHLDLGGMTMGLYVVATRTTYVVAWDPAHLDASERLVLAHERAHRMESLYGWDAAAPLWAALPVSYIHHIEILRRLRAEHWINQ